MKTAKFIAPILLVLSMTGCSTILKNLRNIIAGDDSSSQNSSQQSSGNASSGNQSSTGDSYSYSYEPYQALTSWPSDISSAFESYIGEMVPFVALNANSIYGGYDNSYESYGYGILVVGDNSKKNVVGNYASLLTSNGYSEGTDEEDNIVYTKTSSNGKSLELYFDYYQATAEYPAGNEIVVYFNI